MPQVDPNANHQYILEGRIVSMNANLDILERGRICVKDSMIIAVLPLDAPLPAGFSTEEIIRVGGTIYPGMIELHNHLPYNILPFWVSEQRYNNHTQWKRKKAYRQFVTGPMQTLGKTSGFPGAIVRYTECKSLLGGVTTSQGWTLANSQIRKRYYHGLIRNVEETNEPGLPEAEPRISDVTDARKFKQSIKEHKTKLLHLSEGTDEKARRFFTNLQIDEEEWAITSRLSGIHCTGLAAEDFETLAENGGSMVWSPLSNLILYGNTANIKAAKANDVLIALGADWSPSGSKNLLEELKVADLVSEFEGDEGNPVFTPHELVKMVTCNPAKILGWDELLGTIEPNKKADLVVVTGLQGDPYRKLLDATERNLSLVIINGVPRCGQPQFLSRFNMSPEQIEMIEFAGSERFFFLEHPNTDPIVSNLSLTEAASRLANGLANIQSLAIELENSTIGTSLVDADGHPASEDWVLIPDFHQDLTLNALEGLDEIEIPEWGTAPELEFAISYSEIALPLTLDRLTVVDDEEHFRRLARQPNIPDYIREGLPIFYDRTPIEFEMVPFFFQPLNSPTETVPVPLATFQKTTSDLSVDEKQLIIAQAALLLDKVYVHLDLKQSMYATYPLERLRVLRNELENTSSDLYQQDVHFHRELLQIFSSLRDLHTNYTLPHPYKGKFAYLPFLVEECFEFPYDEFPRFMVTRIVEGPLSQVEDFQEGVEIISWNNIPMERFVQLHSTQQSGSNEAARRARGIDTLTLRPLAVKALPDETKVQLAYRTIGDNTVQYIEIDWLVSSFDSLFLSDVIDDASDLALGLGIDFQTNAVNSIKERFFGSKIDTTLAQDWFRGDHYPALMRGRVLVDPDNSRYAYLRIFSFAAREAQGFVKDFKQIIDQIQIDDKVKGLIIDLRGNGGGLITASELLLWNLIGDSFKAQDCQFINSDLTWELCQAHDQNSPFTDLSLWAPSIRLSRRTGETYSLGFPITKLNDQSATGLKQAFSGPMLLITDALCYSATDIFVAGFKDHQAGKILGVHENTGAGGANVWTHSTLRTLYNYRSNTTGANNPFKILPKGANMRVAVRRTLRQGNESRGLPVEDLGVHPDFLHKMTLQDLMENNVDLLNRAISMLRE
ncbi:MAG: amidohydrolase family protein [Cyanothece sp. SIO1E1]|nr:amidohydrolase family protein [Cyanothece sp. SIO1E1]